MAFEKDTTATIASDAPAREQPASGNTTIVDVDKDDAQSQTEQNAAKQEEDQNEYPTGVRFALLLLSVFVSMFLVALDRLIISTAIPEITNEFHSLQDVGWYGSAYLLTTCSFQLMFGKLYTFYSVKATFLITVFIFEIGSAICGAAPSSVVFIVGRAIQGVGAAGLFSGVIVVIMYAVPLHKRPLYQGMFGAIFGLASILGPLVGGAFTSNVSWRWCFYINIPFGAVAMVVVAWALKVPNRKIANLTLTEKLKQLDPLGTAALVPGVVCLLLALQWGGSSYAWNDGKIIALLTLGFALLIAFIAVQIFLPDTATLPPRLFKQRSIVAGVWSTTCIGASMMIFVYFVPIWFQAIKGDSAVLSGIHLLPLTLSMVVASISNGIFVSKIGYYAPPMIVGVCIMSVGAGLFLTFELDTSQASWIGYQILYGFGLGMSFQAPNLAAQTVLPTKDVPVGTSLMFFTQLLSGAIFISVGQNVLNNELVKRLVGIPGFSPQLIEDTGATSLSTSLPENLRQPVLLAYNLSLRQVFMAGVGLTCLTILGAASLEWQSVKKNQPPKVAKKDAEAGEHTSAQESGDEKDVAKPV